MTDWQNAAACRNHDPYWWFPEGFHKEGAYRIARAVCVRCPVIADCLRHVLTTPETDGMWAALTPAERDTLRRPRPLEQAS